MQHRRPGSSSQVSEPQNSSISSPPPFFAEPHPPSFVNIVSSTTSSSASLPPSFSVSIEDDPFSPSALSAAITRLHSALEVTSQQVHELRHRLECLEKAQFGKGPGPSRRPCCSLIRRCFVLFFVLLVLSAVTAGLALYFLPSSEIHFKSWAPLWMRQLFQEEERNSAPTNSEHASSSQLGEYSSASSPSTIPPGNSNAARTDDSIKYENKKISESSVPDPRHVRVTSTDKDKDVDPEEARTLPPAALEMQDPDAVSSEHQKNQDQSGISEPEVKDVDSNTNDESLPSDDTPDVNAVSDDKSSEIRVNKEEIEKILGSRSDFAEKFLKRKGGRARRRHMKPFHDEF